MESTFILGSTLTSQRTLTSGSILTFRGTHISESTLISLLSTGPLVTRLAQGGVPGLNHGSNAEIWWGVELLAPPATPTPRFPTLEGSRRGPMGVAPCSTALLPLSPWSAVLYNGWLRKCMQSTDSQWQGQGGLWQACLHHWMVRAAPCPKQCPPRREGLQVSRELSPPRGRGWWFAGGLLECSRMPISEHHVKEPLAGPGR